MKLNITQKQLTKFEMETTCLRFVTKIFLSQKRNVSFKMKNPSKKCDETNSSQHCNRNLSQNLWQNLSQICDSIANFVTNFVTNQKLLSQKYYNKVLSHVAFFVINSFTNTFCDEIS